MAPTPEVTYPRLVAASGPKMVALAGTVANGALPAIVRLAPAHSALGLT